MDENVLAIYIGLGIAFGLAVGVLVSILRDGICKFCGRRHIKRFENMTARDFTKFFCKKEWF